MTPEEWEDSARPLTPNEPEFFFWLRHARRAQEPVVILAAGAGRVAIPLAQEEIRVLAIEGDEAQRQQGQAASAQVGAEVLWQVGKPADFSLPRPAAMIALPDGALERCLDMAAQRATLAFLYGRLQVGGKLVLALGMPDIRAMGAQQAGGGSPLRWQGTVAAQDGDGPIQVWEAVRYDLARQRVSRQRLYEASDSAGLIVRRWQRTDERAYFWPREMRLLLEGARFEIEACYGGWNDEPLDAAAPMQIWVARKGV